MSPKTTAARVAAHRKRAQEAGAVRLTVVLPAPAAKRLQERAVALGVSRTAVIIRQLLE